MRKKQTVRMQKSFYVPVVCSLCPLLWEIAQISVCAANEI